jgi:hypothetical protein
LLITATFYGIAFFYKAKFHNKTDFSSAKFSDNAWFSIATFSDEADFSSAKFSDAANFFAAVFSKNLAVFEKVRFTELADFSKSLFKEATFSKEANFMYAKFSNFADFSSANFLNEVRFLEAKGSKMFEGNTLLNYTIFEQPTKAIFDTTDLSKVSFAGTDVSKVTFTDRVKWGGKDGLKVVEEEWIEQQSEQKEKGNESVSLDLVLYVYRRLRENYEFKLKFDAGKFFIKEMELKRNYRTIHSKDNPYSNVIKKNNWFRRHFSLTGLYYHFSDYGESIVKPTIIGAITVALSTFFWLMQSKPILEPHFFVNSSLYNSTSHFVYLNQAGNFTHWLTAFQRSVADFLPLLSLPGDIKV